MPTLKIITKKLKEHLKSESDFGKQCSSREIFQYLWEFSQRNPVQLPNVSININKKSSELSEAFRNEGNRLYRQKKLQKALEAYNFALITAPHPDDFNECEKEWNELPSECKYPGMFSHLAYAYANRSALLYEMNECEKALSDIRSAVAYGYPSSKQHKLCERRIKCLISLEKFSEAHSLVLLLEEKLVKFSLDEKELKSFKSDLFKLAAKCCVSENGQNDSPKYEQAKPKSNKVNPKSAKGDTDSTQKLTKLTSSQNKLALTVPVKTSRNNRGTVSTALGIQYADCKGRQLVALRDIAPGEVLLVEDCHVYMVGLNACLRTHCNHCLRRVCTPVPCRTCSLVVFCDAACRSAAETSREGHASECGLLPALVALRPDLDAYLALRSIIAFGWHKFSKNARKIDSNSSDFGNSMKEAENQLKEMCLDLNDICEREDQSFAKLLDTEELDYKFLTSLEDNLSSRNTEELIDAGIHALVLLKVLVSNEAFWKSEEHCIDPTTLKMNDFLTLGCYLMIMMLKIQCNAHCIKELIITGSESQQQRSYLDVGYGLYQKMSLLNHSCDANAHQSNVGKKKVLYSISTITRGEEITISYGERFASHRKESRIGSLRKAYRFSCNCRACANNWPIFQDLPMKFCLRCCKCSSPVDPSSKKCKSCHLEHSGGASNVNKKGQGKKGKKGAQKENVQSTYDVSSCNMQITTAWKQYNEAFKNIENGLADAHDLQKISQLILLMDKYAVLPNKPYIEAQETCIRWFDVNSNATRIFQ